MEPVVYLILELQYLNYWVIMYQIYVIYNTHLLLLNKRPPKSHSSSSHEHVLSCTNYSVRNSRVAKLECYLRLPHEVAIQLLQASDGLGHEDLLPRWLSHVPRQFLQGSKSY